MIPFLDDTDNDFPSTALALDEPNGLLCAGGDLHWQRLLQAYSKGIFPWFSDDQPILWWSPSPRCIIEPGDLHISKSMKKVLRKSDFSFSFDLAFADVIKHCAGTREYSEGTWITDDMRQAYCILHERGFAHSLEVWQEQQLVGGLYGVAIGRAFFGESMFSKVSNASKAAFIQLNQQLFAAGFELIDCQVESEHLLSLGAKNINREQFEKKLTAAIHKPCDQSPWEIHAA